MEPIIVDSPDPTPRQPLTPGANVAARPACDPALRNRFTSRLNEDTSGSQSSESTPPYSAGIYDEDSPAQSSALIDIPAGLGADGAVPRAISDSAARDRTSVGSSRGESRSAVHVTPLGFAPPVGTSPPMTQMLDASSHSWGGAPVLDDSRLQALLQQLCSGVYTAAESSANGSRMLLALDSQLPAASVELVRESTYLRVRLQARDGDSLRSMVAHRDALQSALGDATDLQVTVEIIGQEEN